MAVRLRYLAHDLEVPMGQFVIGRSPDCQLSLDDPLVSRRHALLTVRADGVTIEDLGSRNGVSVNDAKIEGRRKLSPGDRITIGTQEMAIDGFPDPGPPPSTGEPLSTRGPRSFPRPSRSGLLPSVEPPSSRGDDGWSDQTTVATLTGTSAAAPNPDKRVHALSLIGSVADKALAMGRAEEAERILQRSLMEILERARSSEPNQGELTSRAAAYAAKLAGATGRGFWVDYIFELYTLSGELLPASTVDELYSSLRKVKSFDLALLRNYTDVIRRKSSGFSPSERFVQQRLEGLERLSGVK